MAQSTNNVLVGACNVSIGKYSSDYVADSDGLWTGVKNAVGVGKDFRGWIRNLSGNGTAITPHGGTGTCTFRDVGLTQEGVEVQYQPDFGEVEVDQILDAAKLFKQKMTVSIATTFAEATLDNLLVVWAQSASTRWTDSVGDLAALVPGELGQAPAEQAIMFVGNAPGTQVTYKQRVYLAARALSVESSTHSYKRNEATVFPVTFRLLPDTAASYSAYGRVVDVT
jgi:hypothetical protein